MNSSANNKSSDSYEETAWQTERRTGDALILYLYSFEEIVGKYPDLQYTDFFIRTLFYKNILDRFREKIKNFCKVTFWSKVLKWQKCDIRTSYVSFIEKIKNFSSENT